MANESANLQGLMALFERRNTDGTYAFTDAEVRHYLPYLVLAARVPFANLDPAVKTLVGQLVVDAKLDLTAGAAAVQEKIEAHYALKPFNAVLHKEVLALVRGALGGGSDGAGRQAVEALLGGGGPKGVLQTGERPAGTAPGGVLGRLALHVPPKKK